MFRSRRTRYTATVKAVSLIAPRMARITLGGPGMSAFRCDEPTQWVKLFGALTPDLGHTRHWILRI